VWEMSSRGPVAGPALLEALSSDIKSPNILRAVNWHNLPMQIIMSNISM